MRGLWSLSYTNFNQAVDSKGYYVVKTLTIETDIATLTVCELSGFSEPYTAHLHDALIKHITGLSELPAAFDEISKLLSPAGWNAVIKYTKMVQQTRCVQWKVDPLFTLPSEYASYPMHTAAFEAVRFTPSDFLKAWLAAIDEVNRTENDRLTEGKTPGE